MGNPDLVIPRELVFETALKEVTANRAAWDSYRLLDQTLDGDFPTSSDDLLHGLSHKGLEHVFALLSLVLPREPLRVAFHGLHTEDEHLRGSALEYLETILPPKIRDRLWPLLEARREAMPPQKSGEDALRKLMNSSQAIEQKLIEERLGGYDTRSGSEDETTR